MDETKKVRVTNWQTSNWVIGMWITFGYLAQTDMIAVLKWWEVACTILMWPVFWGVEIARLLS